VTEIEQMRINKRPARNRLRQYREGAHLMGIASLTREEFEVLCLVFVASDNDIRRQKPQRLGPILQTLCHRGWIEAISTRLCLTEKAMVLFGLTELPHIYLPEWDPDDPLTQLFVGHDSR